MSVLKAAQPRTQFYTDDKYTALINTWPKQSVFVKYAEAILKGKHRELTDIMQSITPEHKVYPYMPTIVNGLICGVSTKRIGESNKFEAQLMADDLPLGLDKQFVRRHMPRKAIDIPMAWLERDSFRAINSQIVFHKAQGMDMEGNTNWVPAYELNHSHFLLKCLIMCATSQSREFWKSRIPTLIKYENYSINAAINDLSRKDNMFCVEPEFFHFGIKEEHGLKGFYKTKAENSLNTVYNEEGVKCFELPKKAIARDSRLVDTPEAIPYGTHKVFVAYDASNSLIADWFVTGSAYVPMKWIETRGLSRCVAPVGVKMTTAPMTLEMEKVFGDSIVLSKASFKSGIQGIYAGLTGKTPDEVSESSEEEILAVLKKNAVKRTFLGVDVAGFEFETELFATNLMALYGLRSKDEEDTEEDVNENGDMSEELTQSSYYLWALEQIKEDPSFDLVGDINSKLKNNELRYLPHNINIKTQEFSVAQYSYGTEISDEWIKTVLTASLSENNGRSKIRGSIKEVYDHQTGALKFEQYTMAQMNHIIKTVYNKICITAGKFDINNLGTQDGVKKIHDIEDAKARLNYLLEGGTGWTGLLSECPKMVKIVTDNGDTYNFYLPSGKTMKEYIHKEDGSDRIFFSGPAGDFLKLLLSIRNGGTNGTDWKIKHLNHNVGLQSSILGKNMDNFAVSGGNYTMLPAPWLAFDEISILNSDVKLGSGEKLRRQLPVRDNERVTFSKMPVLFDKAVADMRLVTTLPPKLFGETSERTKLAMRNMMFANVNIMLTHQNDTDGDMGRISCTGGVLPVYSGVPEYMKPWVENYMEDEYDLKLQYKPYKHYSLEELNAAVHESMENKQYIGRATNDLFYLSHILGMYVSKDVIDFDHAQLIRGAYAQGMQDAVVSGIKHNNEKESFDFKLCNSGALFYGRIPKDEARSPREELYKMVKFYTNQDLYTVIADLFAQFDHDAINPTSPLAVRRSKNITDYVPYKASIEDDMKLLDCLTRSYVSNVAMAQPTFGNWFDRSDKEKEAKALILTTYAEYCDKFVLIGQDLSTHGEGTMMHSVLNIWKELSTNDYDEPIKHESAQASLGGALGTRLKSQRGL